LSDKKILIAGASGYLGQHLVREAKRQGCWVRALARNEKKLAHLENAIDDLFVGEVTQSDSVLSVCEGIDFVISSVGITRQKDGFTYMDVDYQGNRNLLDSALKHGVSKFIYVSVFGADRMWELKIIQAKEKFVRELTESGLDYTIVRPTGFFSDMLEFLEMARKGKVNLFGDGEYRINPIHGQDIAEVCMTTLARSESEVEVGGPETFSHKRIAEMAFEVLGKPARIACMPLWMKSLVLVLMRLFTSSKTYGPVEFIWTALSTDAVAPAYGKERLKDFFTAHATHNSH